MTQPTMTPRQSFRQAYMDYSGITEAQMPSHRKAAAFLLAVVLIATVAFFWTFGWAGLIAIVLATLMVWGLPVVGLWLAVVLGSFLLVVWG